MRYIDKYSKHALFFAVIIILILIFTRPKSSPPANNYKAEVARLEKEKQDLLVKRDSMMASLEVSKAEMEKLKKKDTVLIDKFNSNIQLITVLKKDHAKKIEVIDHFSSDDLKRSFAELTDPEER